MLLKVDHRLTYKKYTAPLPSMGCGAVERHLEMAQPTKKKCFRRSLHDDCFCFQLQRYDSDVTLTSIIDKTPKISVSSIDFDQNGEWIDSNP